MKCHHCQGLCIKHGLLKEVQRYKCKQCKRTQLESYVNKAWIPDKKKLFKRCLERNAGVRGMCHIVEVSKSTILKWIREGKKFKRIDASLILPGDDYEMDEVHTHVGNKDNDTWIMYAISRTTKLPIALKVGRRGSVPFITYAKSISIFHLF